MGPYEYLLIRIDGDYADLQRVDQDGMEPLRIARALLPPEVRTAATPPVRPNSRVTLSPTRKEPRSDRS